MNVIEKYYRSGRTPAFLYYLRAALWELVPGFLLRRRLRRLLRSWESRPDADYLRWRRDFYCMLEGNAEKAPDDVRNMTRRGEKVVRVRDVTPRLFQSRYALDARRLLRYFPQNLLIRFRDGDVMENSACPAVMKARRLGPGAVNGVLLRLDSIRHYLRPHDPIPYREKEDLLLFRGDTRGKPDREALLRRWSGHPLMDLGDTAPLRGGGEPSPWHRERISVAEHFRYKFILTPEGNDVSSALQWVMASGCVPVMPRPTCETWLMHSRLVPGVHYIEVKADYSDLAEKIGYYIAHPEEGERISEASREWAEQFFDDARERDIALLVLARYFSGDSGRA